MNTRLNVLAINIAQRTFKSHYSGYIGIAPYSLEKNGEGELAQYVIDPNNNFLYQLKQRKNIKHMVVSFFTTQDKGIKTSSIKFGGWDPSAIDSSDQLKMVQTEDAKSWALKLNFVQLGQ